MLVNGWRYFGKKLQWTAAGCWTMGGGVIIITFLVAYVGFFDFELIRAMLAIL